MTVSLQGIFPFLASDGSLSLKRLVIFAVALAMSGLIGWLFIKRIEGRSMSNCCKGAIRNER